ncbi:MAG: hypothetical protein P0Y53_08605 [Candidatus Pseudobacter hemicellulosilyticus]|uniref:Uncharacterized protein n=1 Tax=Candidatus Pseudobacter hemicellulosilyticus TaxID=3121375 RepID=A0AAJ5WUU2_9BACT|nr:MAG: hypothetical protein P0Y53_08605 [Pseudobacter sp.]
MAQAEQTWKRVNDKLQQVLQQYQQLQKDNERLRKELTALQDRDGLQARQVQELENKVAALKLATGQLEEADRKELEKKLHHYIREIDRCIALLGE